MAVIDIVGGGPAGAMAAIAALSAGARVRVFERAVFPRHKVCGEFLSSDVTRLLEAAGCLPAFEQLTPVPIRRMELHFGPRVVRHELPHEAFGLSRYALDRLLLDRAVALGAEVVREAWTRQSGGNPLIRTNGRTSVVPTGERLFGFKTHAPGVADDTVALYFFDGCYVGVSGVEGGEINVCGLAPEPLLRACGFQPARLWTRCSALARRLDGLAPSFDWLHTGPLVFGFPARVDKGPPAYLAGDALGFIDPFTGSGILNAMLTGHRAGLAAAQGVPPQEYEATIRRALRRPFVVSCMFRGAIRAGVAGPLASWMPGRWLFHLTRPVVTA